MSASVIAIAGLAGAGKSTVAEHLVTAHGYVRVRFADPLKAMLRAIGLGDAEIEGALKERSCTLLQGKTPRWAMQSLGTEWGRDLIGPDFWVGLWERAALDVIDHGGRVVAEDCRFANEAAAVRRADGRLWLIDRPGLVRGGHPSEQLAVPVDHYCLSNASTVDALRAAVDRAMRGDRP